MMNAKWLESRASLTVTLKEGWRLRGRFFLTRFLMSDFSLIFSMFEAELSANTLAFPPNDLAWLYQGI